MKGSFARYFTANRFARWPLWKALISGALAVAVAGGGMGAAAAAASAADAPVPAASPSPAPTAAAAPAEPDASWLALKWKEAGIVPARQRATEAQITMEISVSQQKIGVDLYETNRLTGKKSPFTDAEVTVTLHCVSLSEVKDAANRYGGAASKEGAVTDYTVEKGSASLLIAQLDPGKYTVSTACADPDYRMPAAQNVQVGEKVNYHKTDAKAEQATASDLKEDQKETNSGGNAVTLTPTKNTKAYIVAVSDARYLWENGGKYYLYYADGAKSPYAAVLGTGSDAGGQSVTYLKSGVYDAAAAALLAGGTASPAPTGTVQPSPGVSASPAPTGTAQPSPGASASPAPTGTARPSPGASASPAPTGTAQPSPDASASPAPTATASPVPAPSAGGGTAGSPAAALALLMPRLLTASVVTAPSAAPASPAPAAQVELFSETNGAAVASGLFRLPEPGTLILGGSPAGGETQGIDVSYHQGRIDFAAVRASGIDFVIIRVGYRGYGSGKIVLDPNFHTYMKAAKAAGLRVGVYFFSQAISAEEGVEEASAALNAVAGYGLEYPLFIDSEYSTSARTGRADGLSQAARTEAVVAFCETVRNSGYRPGVYASTSWYRSQLNFATVSQYTVWNAHYGVAASPLACGMWQYTSRGKVAGIATNVDLNVSYIG